MNKIPKIALPFSLILSLLFTACTWVKLTPEAQEVRIATEEEISNCTKKGQTTVSLKASVIGVKRSREKVKEELRTLGRNAAVRLEGNTIVAASIIENGQQTFDVYECSNN